MYGYGLVDVWGGFGVSMGRTTAKLTSNSQTSLPRALGRPTDSQSFASRCRLTHDICNPACCSAVH